MDILDSEPYLQFAPKRVMQVVGFAVLAVSASARAWVIDHADRHVRHEIQPMIDQIIKSTMTPAKPSPDGRDETGLHTSR
jgi:hypothetical protein